MIGMLVDATNQTIQSRDVIPFAFFTPPFNLAFYCFTFPHPLNTSLHIRM